MIAQLCTFTHYGTLNTWSILWHFTWKKNIDTHAMSKLSYEKQDFNYILDSHN